MKIRVHDAAAAGFGVMAVASFSLALLQPHWSGGNGLDFRSSLQVGNLRPHEAKVVEFRLKNSLPRPIRLLGGYSRCGSNVCLLVDNLPPLIQPSAELSIPITVQGGLNAGAFSEPVSIYTDCPGNREIVLTLTGRTLGPQARGDGGL